MNLPNFCWRNESDVNLGLHDRNDVLNGSISQTAGF